MDNLKKALESAMQKDFERYENTEHDFSEEFESEMIKLTENVSKSPKKAKRFGRRLMKVFAAAAAAVALFAVGTFAGAASSGFNIAQSKWHGLPTKLFTAADTEDCPDTIEMVYTIVDFPADRTTIHKSDDGKYVDTTCFTAPWEKGDDGQMRMTWENELDIVKIISFEQETKEHFKFEYEDMEYVTYEPLSVNGRQGYFISRERFYGLESYLIWENEDYIFTLRGCFSEEKALELAGSLVVYDGELPFLGARGGAT